MICLFYMICLFCRSLSALYWGTVDICHNSLVEKQNMCVLVCHVCVCVGGCMCVFVFFSVFKVLKPQGPCS